MKELYQDLTIVGNTLVVLLLMYTQKAVRMVLHPEKNTKQYFQEKRMSEIRESVNGIKLQGGD